MIALVMMITNYLIQAVSTFKSVFSTMIFSVEINRSTSVLGWGSPSDACVNVKNHYFKIMQRCCLLSPCMRSGKPIYQESLTPRAAHISLTTLTQVQGFLSLIHRYISVRRIILDVLFSWNFNLEKKGKSSAQRAAAEWLHANSRSVYNYHEES